MTGNPQTLDVPPATRARAPGWRDPRMWVGIVLVAVSVVAGARLVGGSDDSVQVWALARDVPAGQELSADDLVAARVSFARPGQVDSYLRVDRTLPAQLHLVRPLAAGELVPAAAFGEPDLAGLAEVSLSLDAAQVPTGVEAGSLLDVWVIGEPERGRSRAEEVLTDVRVLAAPRPQESFGSVSGSRQLVIGVDPEQSEALAVVLGATGDDTIRVVAGG